jgi:tetrahydromethanopterin S-methyltransferase subunit D
MAIVVWVTVGLALWHFSIFVPERFWQGIIGALLGALAGALVSGALIQIALGKGLNETDMITFLAAVPGTLIGVAFIYWIGTRSGEPELEI